MTDRTKSDTDTVMVPQHRPIADGREFRALVTVETAERLAVEVFRTLDYSPAIRNLPMVQGACAFLRALAEEMTMRTATEVRSQADSDDIAAAAFKRVREIRDEVNKPIVAGPLEFSWVPTEFTLPASNAAPEPHQQQFITPAGLAVITAIADGTFEIETTFREDETRLYNDTLSADAAMARLFALVAAHTAKAEA